MSTLLLDGELVDEDDVAMVRSDVEDARELFFQQLPEAFQSAASAVACATVLCLLNWRNGVLGLATKERKAIQICKDVPHWYRRGISTFRSRPFSPTP